MNSFNKISMVLSCTLASIFLFIALVLEQDYTQSIFWLLFIDSLLFSKFLWGKNE